MSAAPDIDQHGPAPSLHQDVPPQESGSGLGVVAWMAVVIAVALLLVYAFYSWAP